MLPVEPSDVTSTKSSTECPCDSSKNADWLNGSVVSLARLSVARTDRSFPNGEILVLLSSGVDRPSALVKW